MNVQPQKISDTRSKLTVSASQNDLEPIKQQVLQHLAKDIKLPGFRSGKAPLALVEKNVDSATLQSEFLQTALESLYVSAINQERLRVVDQPEIAIAKFVPFTQLEFTAEVDIIGQIKLPDYKKIKKTKPTVKITDKDVEEVVASLQTRAAEHKDVDRAAKNNDQVYIDFKGVDAKGEPINGAEGSDYPLILGSNAFIPGFEDNLVGLKGGDEKTFTLTFPKDYGVKALANKKVTFTVSVTKVQEVSKPKVDDKFAGSVGPFKTVTELKADIKKQLEHERGHEADRELESEIVKEIAEKTTFAIPQQLIDDQVERLISEIKQNLMYRGQTFPDFLKAEGKTEDEYKKDVLEADALQRVKGGLVLAEIAEKEGLQVTPEELEIRIQVLKSQYKDQAMQAELEKPENRQDIASRLLTEKTVNKLVTYATGK